MDLANRWTVLIIGSSLTPHARARDARVCVCVDYYPRMLYVVPTACTNKTAVTASLMKPYTIVAFFCYKKAKLRRNDKVFVGSSWKRLLIVCEPMCLVFGILLNFDSRVISQRSQFWVAPPNQNGTLRTKCKTKRSVWIGRAKGMGMVCNGKDKKRLCNRCHWRDAPNVDIDCCDKNLGQLTSSCESQSH